MSLPKNPKPCGPTMWDKGAEPVKKKSLRQERRLSKEHGLRTTIMSGALPSVWQKEDAYDADFQVQMKRTEGKDARIITLEALEVLVKNAYSVGRHPMLMVTFAAVSIPVPQDWVLVPADVWKEYTE